MLIIIRHEPHKYIHKQKKNTLNTHFDITIKSGDTTETVNHFDNKKTSPKGLLTDDNFRLVKNKLQYGTNKNFT